MRFDLKGIIPAIMTPMNDDQKLDEDVLKKYVNWIIPQGIKAIAINTDAGEGAHLTQEEKIRVIQIVKEESKGRVPVISGIIGTNTAVAVENAKEMADAGADALMVIPIVAFRGASGKDKVTINYHEALNKVGIPLVLFQLHGGFAGTIFTSETLTELVAMDQVVAIKDASFDAVVFKETVRVLKSLPKQITILTGNDNFIYESFLMGAEGALIGFGAMATEIQCRMVKAHQEGNIAEAYRLFGLIEPLVDATFGRPLRDYRARLKEALVIQGVFNQATVRSPLLPIDDEAKKQVREALIFAGVI